MKIINKIKNKLVDYFYDFKRTIIKSKRKISENINIETQVKTFNRIIENTKSGNNVIDFRIPTLKPLSNCNNPIITASMVNDKKNAVGVADPFITKENGIFYCFFEICTGRITTSELGYAFSYNGITWNYGCKLKGFESRCAFPNVFKYRDNWYMIPDTSGNIDVYKAVNFPEKWVKVNTLIEGRFSDTDIVEINGIWYLFTLDSQRSNSITIYYNESGCWNNGNWIIHPKESIIKKSNSRLGGRIIKNSDNTLILTVQGTVSGQYGEITEFYQISNISSEILVVSDGVEALTGMHGDDWTNLGIHQIDILPFQNGNLYAVDGLYDTNENYSIGLYTDGERIIFASFGFENNEIETNKWINPSLAKLYDNDFMFYNNMLKIKNSGYYLFNFQIDVDKIRILINNAVKYETLTNIGNRVMKLEKGDIINFELYSTKSNMNNSSIISFIEVRKVY